MIPVFNVNSQFCINHPVVVYISINLLTLIEAQSTFLYRVLKIEFNCKLICIKNCLGSCPKYKFIYLYRTVALTFGLKTKTYRLTCVGLVDIILHSR